jgi:hypothetical protein
MTGMNEIKRMSSPKIATVVGMLAGGAASEKLRGHDAEDRREDAEEWGYQWRAEGGNREHQADDADTQ